MSDNPYVYQKASKWTLFVFIVLALSTSYVSANNCSISQFHETVQVAHVFDGDTIKLVDGRKLRLIGINTPERGRNGAPDEPFYQAAKDHLKTIIKQNKNSVKITFGEDKHDRHKRFLAHIFSMKNEDITSLLLNEGLGFTIAIPPNIQYLKCYQNAEMEARKNKRGIWSHQYSHPINVIELKKTARGFYQVRGTIQRVGESRSSYWLNLNTQSNSKFALRIFKKNLKYFKKFHPENLLNHTVIARGWIYQTKNEQRMTIHHPASLQIQNTD